jgi:hypothetical protein
MNLVEIDYRFGGKPSGETYDGFPLMSFEAEKKYVDRAKELGWDGISFVTNTPVNRATGKVQTENTTDPNNDPDRTYPDDLWKLVDYAKSIGLKVHIQLEIVDYLTDVLVSPQNLAPSVVISELFKSIQDYQSWMAKDAQFHGVDSINIGSLYFLEEQYKEIWLKNIVALRDVFKGQLSVTTNYNSQPLSFYSLLDFINVFGFGDNLANYWPNSAEEIIRLYTKPEGLFGNGTAQPNQITKLDQFIKDCPVPIILLRNTNAVTPGPGTNTEPLQPWVSSEIQPHLKKYLTEPVDYTHQLRDIEAFYNIINDHYVDKILGTVVGQYGSWADDKYYFLKPNSLQEAFYVGFKIGFQLNPAWNPVADIAISKYLSPDHPHDIQFDAISNGQYIGLNGQNNSFVWMTGNDVFTGAEQLDKAFAPGKMKDAKLIRSDDALTITASVGNLTLKAVERIVFSDQAIAYDMSGFAGMTAKTLGAVFGKDEVNNKSFVGIGLHFLDELNFSYPSLIELAINARLGANATHAQVVDLLYTNVVRQAPDSVTRKSFTDLLDNGTLTVSGLGVLAAETELNKVNINLVGLAQTGLEYLPFSS